MSLRRSTKAGNASVPDCGTVDQTNASSSSACENTESELLQSKQFLKLFIERAPASLAMFDRNMRYLQASDRWCADYHVDKASIIGASHYDVFPNISADWKEAHQRGLRGETLRQDEDRFIGLDGKEVWLKWEICPWGDPDADNHGIIIFTEDITARKQSEKALERSNQFLELAFSAAHATPWEAELAPEKEELLSAPIRSRGFYGGTSSGTVAEALSHLDPRDYDSTLNCILEAVREGREYACEYRVETPESGQRWFFSKGRPSCAVREGSSLNYVGLTMDITERKHAEEALSKRLIALTQPLECSDIALTDLFNVEELQKIQDSFAQATGVASLITTADGIPITQPSRFCPLCSEMIRKTDKGLKNCMLSDTVIGRQNPNGPTIMRCLSAGLWDAGASISVGGRHIANWLIGQVKNADVDESEMLTYARELGLDEDKFLEALANVPSMSTEQFKKVSEFLFQITSELSLKAYQNIQQARFITERKRAEEERCALEQRLLQSQKMEAVGRLAGGVAHDMNNVLQAIILPAQLLLMSETRPSARRKLEEMVEVAERGASVSRQLLAFSRQQVLQRKIVNVHRALSGMQKMLRQLIREDIALSFVLESDSSVLIDPGHLIQVVMNLVVNAQDAMPDGGQITIRLADTVALDGSPQTESANPLVEISVEDTGCGMTPEVRQRIFEPFFTTKGVGKGTGLGLATVYGIVEQARGTIEVITEPGHGSTFTMRLPVCSSASDAVPD